MSEEAFIPTVVNESLETIQKVEEEESPSIHAMQPSTSNIVLARRSEPLPNLVSPSTYETSGQAPLGQLRNFSLVNATVGNNGSRRRRGRPPRVKPYIIPEVPSSSSNASSLEKEEIKRRRAREQNKVASQKSRLKKAQK